MHKQHEIYMANAGPSRWGPNATYISLAGIGFFCVGGNANLMFCVGGNARFSVFRYQHVGIPNTKFSRWGCYPPPDPNVKGFATQWNIGFITLLVIC